MYIPGTPENVQLLNTTTYWHSTVVPSSQAGSHIGKVGLLDNCLHGNDIPFHSTCRSDLPRSLLEEGQRIKKSVVTAAGLLHYIHGDGMLRFIDRIFMRIVSMCVCVWVGGWVWV